MKETRRSLVSEPADESQIRRAQRGVVAGYIHELSERHADRHPSQQQTRLSSETGDGAR
jgi:hypothetical protein